MRRGGATLVPQTLVPVVFEALDRASCTRDTRILVPVLDFTLAMLTQHEQPDKVGGGGWAQQHQRFLDKIATDVSHLALLDWAAYVVVVTRFLLPMVERMDLACVRVMPKLLECVLDGSALTDVRTRRVGLSLLLAIMKACDVRVRAHRESIFAGLLRARLSFVTPLGEDAVLFASMITTFRNLVNDDVWWFACVNRVKKAGFELQMKEFMNDALEDVE
jgi:hypothetical protein